MFIIHDSRLPKPAIGSLEKQGNCMSFSTKGITYTPISGHPDIFFCPIDGKIIIAPNTPKEYVNKLLEEGFIIETGQTPIGTQKQNSTCYNAVITDSYIIHNQKYTDSSILAHLQQREFIQVSQAYTRCSLLPLRDNYFITSDKGIEKTLQKKGLDVCYGMPNEIELPEYRYGFIGGCMGIYQNKVFIIGSLDQHSEGEKINSYLHKLGYEIVELYKGKLFDGGSLFFMNL